MIVQAIECIKCGNLHKLDSETYIRIQGNIYIGHSGGIVGNNLKGGDNVESTYFCIGCFQDFIKKEVETLTAAF